MRDNEHWIDASVTEMEGWEWYVSGKYEWVSEEVIGLLEKTEQKENSPE